MAFGIVPMPIENHSLPALKPSPERCSEFSDIRELGGWVAVEWTIDISDHSHFEAVLVERLRTLHDRISMVPVTAARRT